MRTCLRKIGILAATILFAVLCTVGCNTGTSSSDPAPETFTVQMTAGEHGTLTANPAISENGKAAQGTVITFTAVPESGYRVEKWTVTPKSALIAEGKAGNTLAKVKITANTKVNVSFTNDLYTVTLESVDPAKKEAVIKAVSEITGSTLEDATTLVEGVPKVLKENMTESEADEIIAKITEAGGTASRPERYTVSLTPVEHGTVTANPVIPASGKVDKDTEITFTAASAEGYKVGTWTITPSPALQEGGTAGSTTAKVKITAATTVNVSFTKEGYAVTFDAKGGTPVPAAQTVKYKEKASVPSPEPTKEGHTFDGWYNKAGNSLWNFAVNEVTGNTELYAKWRINTYPVTFGTPANGTLKAELAGTVIVSGNPVEYGKTVTFTAAPESGYKVDTWTITPASALQEGGTAGSTTAKVKITAATTVNVSFTKGGYAVTFDADGGTPVPAAQTVKYKEKASVPSPEPTKEGHTFDGWYNKAGNSPWNFAVNEVTQNTELYAKWRINTYTVTYNRVGAVGYGTFYAYADGTLIHSGDRVEYGKTVTVYVMPVEDCQVDKWTITGGKVEEGGTDGSGMAKVKITGNTNIRVSFKNVYIVEMKAGEHGTVSASPVIPPSGKVGSNTVITFTATPDPGYKVDTWTVTPAFALQEGGTNGSLTAKVEITGDRNVFVSFKTEFTVEMTHGANGTVSANPVIPPSGKVTQGTEITFTASPAMGYKVDKWKITGGNVEEGTGTDGNTTAKVWITADTKVNVSFTNTYPVNFDVKWGDGTLKAEIDGTPITSGDTVEYGKTVIFTASPAAEYKIDKWTITGGTFEAGTGTNRSLTAKVKITADTEVEVKFKPLYDPVAFGVNGSGLDTYLKTAAPHTDGIYYIKVTELTKGELSGSTPAVYGDWRPSALGRILKDNPTEKVALKLEKIPYLTDMTACFYECSNLIQAPVIPNGVTNMTGCFYGCTSLTHAPVIPNGVTDMTACFSGCTGLTQAPVIPNSVTNMMGCFYGCTSLTQAPVIPNGVTNMSSCFYNCYRLTQAPVIPNGVTDMSYCFEYCTSLTQAPEIPSSVTDMHWCFYGCKNITAVTLMCSYNPTKIYGEFAFSKAFSGCEKLTAGSIKVPARDLQMYRDNASIMGVWSNRFVAK